MTVSSKTRRSACGKLSLHPRTPSLTRRSLIASAAAGLALAAAGPAAAVPPRRVPFGAAIQAEFFHDPAYRALFRDHCDIVLPMNELKFGLIHPQPDGYEFGPADTLIDFATQNNKRSRGHTIIWWNEVPVWLERLSDPRAAERALRTHVEAVVGRYAGRLESWDVVNEVVDHEAPLDSPLRDTFWQRTLGPKHIPMAFKAVAEADPTARLVINEYDLEFRGERHDRRRATILEIVRQLRDADIRIDAVGLQAHLYADQEIDTEALARFGAALKEMGVGLIVTELDIIDWKIGGGAAAQDAAAEKSVRDLLDGVFAAGPPEAVIAWGMTDRHSWVDDAMPHADGTPSRPLPFDAAGRAKGWFRTIDERLRRG